MTDEQHNRRAWNRLSGPDCPWSRPVSDAELAAARRGQLVVTVAGPKPVPQDWLGTLMGARVLCLAAGGGQQAPLLAAAGAQVTLLDISDEQLALDQQRCASAGLQIDIQQGSMTDLSRFSERQFDLVLNPVSSPYVPDITLVWQQCSRVLGPGGRLISGSINPLNYLFAENEGEPGVGLEVVHALPYVESDTLDDEARQAAIDRDMVFTWSHSLEALIQGQINAGFVIQGLLESRREDPRAPSINRFSPTYLATLGIKC